MCGLIFSSMTQYFGYWAGGTILLHLFSRFVLSERRNALRSAGHRVPELYFGLESYWFCSAAIREKKNATTAFFFRFWDLGSDELAFNIWVVIWRITGLLFVASMIWFLLGDKICPG